MQFKHYKDPFSNKHSVHDIHENASIKDCALVISDDPEHIFTYPTLALLNGKEIMRDDWENVIFPTDQLEFRTAPPRGDDDDKGKITSIVSIVVGAAIAIFAPPVGWALIASGAIGLAASYLIKPETPEAARSETQRHSPTYQLNATNTARPGQPIPVQYGRMRAIGDLASARWSTWADDADGVRRNYLHVLLCQGNGEYDIEEVLIGDQAITAVRDGEYTVYAPGVDSDDSLDREESPDVQSVEIQNFASYGTSMALSWHHSTGPSGQDLTSLPAWATSTAYTTGTVLDVSGLITGSQNTGIVISDHTSDASSISVDVAAGRIWVPADEHIGIGLYWIRATSGSLVASDKPAGAESLNASSYTEFTQLMAPAAAESANQSPIKVIWRWSASGGYDWILASIAHDATATRTITADTETTTLHRIDLTSLSYGPFRIEEADTVNLEFPQGIYLQGGGSVSVRYAIFAYSDTAYLGSHYLQNGIFTEEELIAWGESIAVTALPAGLNGEFAGSRVSYTIARFSDELESSVGIDRMLWTRLGIENASPGANADTTRIKVKFASSQDVQATADKIRVISTRKVPTYSAGAWQDPSATRSVTWAICDFLRNTTYGCGLETTEFDFDGLMDIHDAFAYDWKFDGVFDTNMTRWELLKLICRAAMLKPVLRAGIIHFVYDGAAITTRTCLFTMSNIIDGSWDWSREEPDSDEPDGFEGTYTDPFTWRQATVSKTSAGGTPTNPERAELFGVTDETQAGHLVRQMANAKVYRRNRVSFETGMEGHIPGPGDLVGVSFDVPQWGQSGQIIAVDGLNLTCDHELTWGGGNHDLLLRRPDGSAYGPVAVTQGANAAIVVLPGALDFTPRTDYNGERTHFAFGETGEAATDILVMETVPNGQTSVRISGVEYDANVYNGLPT